MATTRVTGGDLSQALEGLQAGFDEINESGGVNGHQLEVVHCDDQGTTDGATTCAQKFAGDERILGVASLTYGGATYSRVLPQAQIAYMPVLPVFPDDSSRSTLAFTGGSPAIASGALEYLIKDLGQKKVAVFGSVDTDPTLMTNLATPVTEKLGAEVVAGGPLQLTAGQSDFLPLISRAVADGAEGAYFGFLTPGDYVPFLQAYQAAGATFTLVGAGSSVTATTIEAFGDAGVPLYVSNVYNPADGPDEPSKAYQAASEAAGVEVSEFGLYGYGGALAIRSLLEEAGEDVDRASFYELASSKDLNLDPGPLFPGPITRPLADTELYAGVGNMGDFVGKYVDGTYTQEAGPIDTAVYFSGE